MATCRLALKVSFAWWLKPYFYGLAIMSAITGLEPDYERAKYWINRAMKVRVAR